MNGIYALIKARRPFDFAGGAKYRFIVLRPQNARGLCSIYT